jgi:hypothetical protein
VSSEADNFVVQIFRCGAQIERVDTAPGVHDGLAVPFGRPDEAWGWPLYPVFLNSDLADGVYVAVPTSAGPDGSYDPIEPGPEILTRSDACLFVLRRQNLAGRSRVLFKLPTATYAAYNQLGGVSLYAGAHWVKDWTGQGYVVSLQRPGNGGVGGKVMEGDAPDPYARTSRRQVFAHWDYPFVSWLETQGFLVQYCTDFDLHDDPSILDDGPLLVSAGHDEYWSKEMRHCVLEFVDRGGNMCFFAGDVACFEVKFAEAGDRLFCSKMAGGGPDSGGSLHPGALWHVNDPGDWLSLASGAYGGGWWDGRRAIDGYHPVVPSHWVFDGVTFPSGGITGGDETPVIGYETDGVPLERASNPPRLAERKGGSGRRVLLGLAKLSQGWVAGPDQANAAMMIRTARSGGKVFSTGTTDWPLALLSDAAISRITDNAIRKLLDRSLVVHGPTYADGEYLGDGDVVGAGQIVSWYVDGAQRQRAGIADVSWSVVGGKQVNDPLDAHLATQAGEGEGWMTVTASAVGADGARYFASHTVMVLSTEDYLRRRIIRALHAMANPDEQGGALVDQKASEAELAGRVIPIRLQWVKQYSEVLNGLVDQLEEIWTANGRMADASLRPDEK